MPPAHTGRGLPYAKRIAELVSALWWNCRWGVCRMAVTTLPGVSPGRRVQDGVGAVGRWGGGYGAMHGVEGACKWSSGRHRLPWA